MSLLRKMQLGCIKGCSTSTISHEAVIVGVILLDLLVQEMIKRRKDKEPGMDRKERKRMWREETLNEWQQRWKTSAPGRDLCRVPDVKQSKIVKWQTDHYTTQLMSGHGQAKELI